MTGETGHGDSEFAIASYRVTIQPTQIEDEAFEFTVRSDSRRTGRFSIYRPEGGEWDDAMFIMDPEGSDIPLIVLIWAIDYARQNF